MLAKLMPRFCQMTDCRLIGMLQKIRLSGIQGFKSKYQLLKLLASVQYSIYYFLSYLHSFLQPQKQKSSHHSTEASKKSLESRNWTTVSPAWIAAAKIMWMQQLLEFHSDIKRHSLQHYSLNREGHHVLACTMKESMLLWKHTNL